MDTEDRDLDEGLSGLQVEKHENTELSATGDHATAGIKFIFFYHIFPYVYLGF